MIKQTTSPSKSFKNEQFLTTQWDSSTLGKVLVTGVAGVGAVGGLLHEASPASAQIMHFDSSTGLAPIILTPVPNTIALQPWDIDNNGSIDGQLQASYYTNGGGAISTAVLAIGAAFPNTNNFQVVIGTLGPGNFLDPLGTGNAVASGAIFGGVGVAGILTTAFSAFVNNPGNWNAVDTDQFFGFQFTPSGTSTALFGWGRVTRQGITSLTLEEWAFDTTGALIRVGATSAAIPEPGTVVGTLAAIAMGGALTLQQRRKQKAQSGDLTSGESGMSLLAAGAAGIRTWWQEKQQQAGHQSDTATHKD